MSVGEVGTLATSGVLEVGGATPQAVRLASASRKHPLRRSVARFRGLNPDGPLGRGGRTLTVFFSYCACCLSSVWRPAPPYSSQQADSKCEVGLDT